MVAMKVSSSLVRFACVAVFLAAASGDRLRAEEIAGEWEVKMERDGRATFATLTIEKKSDGALGGKWGRVELSNVQFKEGKLSFTRTQRFGDREFSMDYKGTLKDGVLSGELSSERGSFAAIAARPKARSPILGRWSLKYTIGDRDVEATLAVSEKPGGGVDAKWSAPTGEHTVTDAKLQDGKLALHRKSKIEDREFESDFLGSVVGDKLAGTIKTAMGDVPVQGTRVGADLIGRWELTSEGERGPRVYSLVVFSDLTGRYDAFFGEVPFQDLKLDGNQVSFRVETSFGDQTSTTEFKGKLDGKTLKGEVTSPRGSREVTGKKLETPAPAVAVAKPGAAFIGTWEISREGRDGERRTSTLVIQEGLKGTYTQRENTFPLTDLKVDGDAISFKVVVKFGEREVPMEYKGKLEGGALKGQFISERGPREANGTRKTAGASL